MDFYALTYSSMVILTLCAAFLSEKYVFCFIFKFIDLHLVESKETSCQTRTLLLHLYKSGKTVLSLSSRS